MAEGRHEGREKTVITAAGKHLAARGIPVRR